MQMFPVEGVLQQLHDVVSDGILCGKALRPCEDFPSVESGLLDRETEGKAKGYCGFWKVVEGGRCERVGLLGGRARRDGGGELGQESVYRVGKVIYRAANELRRVMTV